MPYFISFIFMLIQAVSAVNPSYKPYVIYKPSFIENRRDYPISKQLAKPNSYKFNQPVKSENTISKFALKLLQDWIRWILIVLPIYFAVNYPPLMILIKVSISNFYLHESEKETLVTWTGR